LTGRAAFEGDDVGEILARVIERGPDWTALPATTPDPIRNLLFGCLAKDSRERLRDIGDVRITIDAILSGSGSTTLAPASRPEKPRAAWLPWAVAAALVVAVTWLAVLLFRPQPPIRVARLMDQLPGDQTLDGSGGAHLVALSRDGTMFAYVSARLLYLRAIGTAKASLVPGIELFVGAREPVFSPSGREIAFWSFADQQLMRMPVSGGPAQKLCDADTPSGISWSPNGTVLFGQGGNGIWRVQASGGPCDRVASVNEDEEAHGPQLLPDEDHFVFTIAQGGARGRWDNAQTWVQSLSQPKDRRRLKINGSDARYVKTGHLVYAVSGNVWAVPFDPDRLEVKGEPVMVQPGVRRAAGSYTGAAHFSVSDEGTFIYVEGPPAGAASKMEISLADPITGLVTPLPKILPDTFDTIRLSPDQSRIAFATEREKEWTLYWYSLSGISTVQRLTSPARYPAWTSDSRRLAFQSNREGDNGIWWQLANGTGEATRLTQPAKGESHIPESWFDNTLLYSVTTKNRASLWTLTIENGKPSAPHPFGTSVSADQMSAVFSPNGRLVAYTLTERVTPTVCVEPFPSGARVCLPQTLADSPKHPRWSPDGSRIFYDPRIGFFESVAVITEPMLRLGEPRNEEFHPFQLAPPGGRTPYDIMKSGKFVALTTPGKNTYERNPQNRIQVVLNWFEELKKAMK